MSINDTCSSDSLSVEAQPLNQQVPVTVVTATYDLLKAGRGEYFRQCAESVHAQTYGNIEHIVIDGASTDGTLDLLKEYEDEGWLSVFSEPDKGIYDAFNKALARANGKYIAFLNSDDWWHDVRGVEHSVHLLELTGAAFSYAPAIVIGSDGRVIGERNFCASCFFYDEPCCHQTMFCRTALLREMGGFDTRFKIIADYHLTFRILMNGGRCIGVPLCFTSFRDGGLSMKGWDSMCQERRSMHAHYYREVLTREQIENISQRIIPPALMNVFAQALHPAIYAEMQRHCFWDERIEAWRFSRQEFPGNTWGFFNLEWKVRNAVTRIIRDLFPKRRS